MFTYYSIHVCHTGKAGDPSPTRCWGPATRTSRLTEEGLLLLLPPSVTRQGVVLTDLQSLVYVQYIPPLLLYHHHLLLLLLGVNLPSGRSTVVHTFYAGVARSRSGSFSFTASALNKLSSSSSSSWVARSRSGSCSFHGQYHRGT